MSRRFSLRHGLDTRGFTLTEVLIAIVILSVGFIGLSAMTLTTVKSLSFSRKLTTATTLSQEKLEEIKNTPYPLVDAASYPQETFDAATAYQPFTRVVTIRNGPLSNTKTVTVTTSWRAPTEDAPHQVELRTIISP